MFTKLFSCELYGLEAKLIEVEIHIYPGKPVFDIIGLPDAAINEAKIRVRSALNNSKISYPYNKRVTANLAPADLRKEGPVYDMAFALGIIIINQDLEVNLSDSLFVGELSLEGNFRHVNGVLSIVDFAKRNGFKKVYLPADDLAEGSLISGIELYPVVNLNQLLNHFLFQFPIEPRVKNQPVKFIAPIEYAFDMAFVKGQYQAKRALEIAASGQHNILMSGPPGSGKSLLAKTLPSILPQMTEEEILEVTKIYSVAGLLRKEQPLIITRPFRSPHHTSSTISLIGGGRIPQPGEICMAHRGVLFLDEFPEFSRQALETLRQPLEDGMVTISRVEATLSYPARFMLVASQNPCPCGYLSDPGKECVCSPASLIRYQNKISGPILDRIDLHVEVPRLPFEDLHKENEEESSAAVRDRVEVVRQIQLNRFNHGKIMFNSQMQAREIKQFCVLDSAGELIIKQAVEQMNLSARGYHRILKLSRTIADLEGSDDIRANHVAESLQYRFK